jgi:acetyl esterase
MIGWLKRHRIAAGFLLLLVVAGGIIYSWTFTPHGRLDWRLAIILKIEPFIRGDAVPLAEVTPEIRAEGFAGAGLVTGEPEPVARVETRTIAGPAGEIPIRVYWPESTTDAPIIVYYHGGAWVRGNLDTHDNTCRSLARRTPAMVVSVEYRKAPENPFPAGLDDAWAALQWVARNAAELGGDRRRIAVAGDSAGGNLAAVVSIMARTRGRVKIVHQALIYPATNLAELNTDSHRDFAHGYFLTRETIEQAREVYAPDPDDRKDPRVSPLLAKHFGGLPSATIITAGFDPLRDEGEAYGERLREAGADVEIVRFEDVVHGFVGMDGLLPQASEALDRLAARLGSEFARRSP